MILSPAYYHYTRFPQQPTRICSLDSETLGLHLRHDSRPFLFCAAFDNGEGKIFRGKVDPFTRKVYWDAETVRQLYELTQHPDWLYVLTNAKFDTRSLTTICPYFDPYEFLTRCHETLGMHHAYHNSESHALKDGAQKYCNIPATDEKDLHDAVNQARNEAAKLGWAIASKRTCPQQVKSPDKGWSVMDMWIPETLAKHYWETSESCKFLQRCPGTILFGPSTPLSECVSKIELDSARGLQGWEWHPKSLDSNSVHPWYSLCTRYCMTDCFRSLAMYKGLQPVLEASTTIDPNTKIRIPLWDVYMQNRVQVPVSYEIEDHGFSFHPEEAKNELTALEKTADSAALAVNASLGPFSTLNPRSPDQIRSVFYETFKLPVTRRTPERRKKDGSMGGANAVTDEDFIVEVIERLLPTDPESYTPPLYNRGVEDYSEFNRRLTYWYQTCCALPVRQCWCFASSLLMYKKANSAATKIKAYLHNAIGSYLYPSLNPFGASTPRYSSSNPNGQNVSKGGKSKKAFLNKLFTLRHNLRKLFGPLPGREWWSIDYGQLQLVIAAVLCKSHQMLEQLRTGVNFHTAMAKIIFGTDDPTDQERDITKNVNFGFWFGAQAEKIDFTCGIPGMYDELAKLFPEAPENLERMQWDARKTGYVTTLGGYRLYIPDESPYAACVYAVQGSEGVLVKKAVYELQYWLSTTRCRFDPDLFIRDKFAIDMLLHDEVDFDAEAGYGQYYVDQAVGIMEDVALNDFGVPAKANAKYHPTDWGSSVKEEKLAI